MDSPRKAGGDKKNSFNYVEKWEKEMAMKEHKKN